MMSATRKSMQDRTEYMTSEELIVEVTDHPPTMVQRGKRTGMAVNGFVSQEVLLPILEIP